MKVKTGNFQPLTSVCYCLRFLRCMVTNMREHKFTSSIFSFNSWKRKFEELEEKIAPFQVSVYFSKLQYMYSLFGGTSSSLIDVPSAYVTPVSKQWIAMWCGKHVGKIYLYLYMHETCDVNTSKVNCFCESNPAPKNAQMCSLYLIHWINPIVDDFKTRLYSVSWFQEQLDAFELEKQALLNRNTESQSEVSHSILLFL